MDVGKIIGCPLPGNQMTEEEMMTGLLRRMYNYLKDVNECALLISIPDVSGSEMDYYYELEQGETTFDFREGAIHAPSGSTAMRTSLKTQRKEVLKSFRIFSDQDITLNIAGMGTLTVIGGESVSLATLCFTQVYLRSSTMANIRLLVSSSDHILDSDTIAPQMVYEELYDADETVANVVTLDTGVFSRTTVEIVSSADVATPFLLESSMDDVHWFTADTFGAATSIHKSYDNAFRYIRFSNTAGGAAGDLVSMIISATR